MHSNERVVAEVPNASTFAPNPREKMNSASEKLNYVSEKVNCVSDLCCHTRFLLENHSNFKKSGPPARFMYLKDGSWTDLEGEVLGSIQTGFKEGKVVMEVRIGEIMYLFDLYRMLQIDLEREDHRSIAWIDVEGKCFFPKTFVEGGKEFPNVAMREDSPFEVVNVSQDLNVKILSVKEDLEFGKHKLKIKISIGGNLDSGKRKREVVGNEVEDGGREKKEVVENGLGEGKREKKDAVAIELGEGRREKNKVSGAHHVMGLMRNIGLSRWPKAKLLGEGDTVYEIVKDHFLTGMRNCESNVIVTAIHQWMYVEPMNVVRIERFKKQLEITKARRGGQPNLALAWYGTLPNDLTTILRYGFAIPRKFAYGVGIYLSPLRSPHTSAMLSDVDGHGEKHVLLCRVILGNCEIIELGSHQQYPSSNSFDSGVDDTAYPRCYVVWSDHMNTHIIPECVVSYKSPYRITGPCRGSLFLKDVTDASNAMFERLVSNLGSPLPPSRVQELRTLCYSLKSGKISRDTFKRQLKAIIGDEGVVSTEIPD